MTYKVIYQECEKIETLATYSNKESAFNFLEGYLLALVNLNRWDIACHPIWGPGAPLEAWDYYKECFIKVIDETGEISTL